MKDFLLHHISTAGFLLTVLGTIQLHAGTHGATPPWNEFPNPPALQKPASSGYAPVNDIELYYAIYGTGEPLILLHGGLANIEYFAAQIPAFAKKYEVIAIDSRGHGRSTQSAQKYSYGLMASDVVALLDYLRISKASIVGWSDGAIIGLDIAIHHPERLVKLVAFAANYNLSGLRKNVNATNTFKQYFTMVRSDYARLSSTPGQFDNFVRRIVVMWSTQPRYSRRQLASIKAPTLVIDGEYDEAIKRTHTEEIADLIPHAKLEILPSVSHFAMLQNPKEFNDAVLQFLRN